MEILRVIRKQDQEVVSSQAKVARSFATRLRGLIGVTRFEPGEALLFPKCNSIHMWMMKIPIDVVFLTSGEGEWIVSSLYPDLKPWKCLPVGDWRADDVLELPAGTIHRLRLKKGEVLCIAS